jgi:hypothetical protein
MTTAAYKMFAFYTNLLSVKAKYTWNKIAEQQMEGNPMLIFKVSCRKAQRGCHVDCMLFHLLTVFPINAAEQEKYYITNLLKKPQCVNVRQLYSV